MSFSWGKINRSKNKKGQIKTHIKYGLRTKEAIFRNKETRKLIQFSKN